MSDPVRLASHVPIVLKALQESDLSLVEMASICRISAETLTQAQILQEIAISMAKHRGAK